jgi:hypothetical protein
MLWPDPARLLCTTGHHHHQQQQQQQQHRMASMLQNHIPVCSPSCLLCFMKVRGKLSASRWGRRTSSGARTGRRSLQRGKPSCRCCRPRRTAGRHTGPLTLRPTLHVAGRPAKQTCGCVQLPCAGLAEDSVPASARFTCNVGTCNDACIGLVPAAGMLLKFCRVYSSQLVCIIGCKTYTRRPQVGGAQAAMGRPGG